MKKLKFTFLFISFIIVFGCRNEQTSKESNETEGQTIEFGELKQEIKEVYYRFPSPDEMFSYVDSTGIRFDKSLLSSYKNIDNYIGTKDQALNMGVYIADLAYISLFQRYKESMDYLQTIYILSDKLRISAAFNNEFIHRIENNIKNSDSLDAISDAAMNRIINHLSRNEQEDVFALISIGGFIEFLNISILLSGEYSSDNIMVRKIADQKIVYENIMKFAQPYAADNNNVKRTLEVINPLTEFFNELKSETRKTTVSKSDEGKLVFGGGKKILLIKKNEFDQLKNIIITIRSKIISADF
jgi:hypothetical protein